MSNLFRLVACLFVLLSFNAFAIDADGFSENNKIIFDSDPRNISEPFIWQKIIPSDNYEGDYFGYDVSISGNIAVVGAWGDNMGTISRQGAAYVYEFINGVWVEQQKLIANDANINLFASGDHFGWNVSISGDTIVIGSPYGGNAPSTGAAYIYERNSIGNWYQQRKITFNDPADGSLLGEKVAIDGDTLIVTARGAGLAHIFERNNTNSWNLVKTFNGNSSNYGYTASVSGETAVVSGRFPARAHVYERIDGVWGEKQLIIPNNEEEYVQHGPSTSISGNTLVVSITESNLDGNSPGLSYIYERINGDWVEQQVLMASSNPGDIYYGSSTSISGDTLVIGAPYYDVNNYFQDTGSVYVYKRLEGVWIENRVIQPNDRAVGDGFGNSVSISGDTAVVGKRLSDDNGENSGSAYIFQNVTPFENTPSSITGDVSSEVSLGSFGFGTLVATDVDGLTDNSYFSITAPPTNGQAIINSESGVWTYIADNFFVGSDPFIVTVTDDLGGTTEQVVSITITAPDSDGDGAYDHQDNCPSVSNADQANLDGDTFGDACDSDIDGDGVDNTLDAFPNDSTESSDSDSDNVGDNTDNCINNANFDQSDIDSDTLGDACDPDMDGDGYANVFEVRFGGDETDNTDAAVSLANAVAFSETAPADSDLDGVPDDVEAMLGEDNTSSTFQDLLDTLSSIATAKNVPAMGSIGLLALGMSMLGLGAVRMRRK